MDLRPKRFFARLLAGLLCVYGLLALALAGWHAGWLPGADHVLAGRHLHSLSHYLRHFTLRFACMAGVVLAVPASLFIFRIWVRNTGGWKRFVPRFVFLIGFTLLLAELALRMAFAMPGGRMPALQNPALLGDPNTDDFYWVLTARLAGKTERDYVLPFRGWGQTQPSEDNPHALRKEARDALNRGGPAIYFYGDSFVHGMPFNTNTLPALVEARRSGVTVINLGVRGYGVDQMYLKARELGLPPPGGEVWVGILTWDLDRAYLEYSYGQKPRYRMHDGDWTLPMVPLAQLDQAYVQAFQLPFRSWVLQLFRQQWRARQGLEREGPDRDEKIALNRMILGEWSAWCREAGVPLRIVLFHTRSDLAQDSWRTRAVHAICGEFGLPLLDTAEVLMPYLEKVGSWGDELYEPGDFHHTDLANTLIAEWLASQWINPEPARTNAATGAR